jgi:hypothetical protein
MKIPKEIEKCAKDYNFELQYISERGGYVTSITYINKGMYLTFYIEQKEVEIAFFYELFKCSVTLVFPHEKLGNFISQARTAMNLLHS